MNKRESVPAGQVPALRVQDLTFAFGDHEVLRNVSLDIEQAEVVAVMGPSGCGKTTLGRLICGFLLPASGQISIAGTAVWSDKSNGGRNVPAHRRMVGVVPQEGALFPHLNVGDNVGFGLPKTQGRAERKTQGRAERIAECLELVGLAGFEHRTPAELSGGQQQRVAVARALAPRPALIVMDEPFSALDAGLRDTTRRQVFHALAEEGTSVLLVTHDGAEALASAHRVAVLDEGRVAQFSEPDELYDRPRSLAVAAAGGPYVALDAVYAGEGGADTALGRVEVHLPSDTESSSASSPSGAPGKVVVRPEQLVIGESGSTAARALDVTRTGAEVWLRLGIENSAQVVTVRRSALDSQVLVGAEVRVGCQGAGMFFADARTAADLA